MKPILESMLRHALLADSIPLEESEMFLRVFNSYDRRTELLKKCVAFVEDRTDTTSLAQLDFLADLKQEIRP